MVSKPRSALIIRGWLSVWVLLVWTLAADTALCNEIVDRIVAVVNDDIITYRELERALEPYERKLLVSDYNPDDAEKLRYKVRTEVLNRMIDEKLAAQEAKKRQIQISESEVDGNIEQMKSANMWTDEVFREMLRREGITMDEYRASLKENVTRAKLVNNAVKSAIVVTDADARDYFDRNREKFEGTLKYHLRNIIMPLSAAADDEAKQRVRQKMQDVYAELTAGASFATLAEQYSESPLAAKGGDLGFIAFEDISPRLQEAVKPLSVGEFTPVIETDQGFQIFYVEDIARIGGKTFEEVRAEIERQLYNELVDEKFKTWLEDLRKNSHIKIIQ